MSRDPLRILGLAASCSEEVHAQETGHHAGWSMAGKDVPKVFKMTKAFGPGARARVQWLALAWQARGPGLHPSTTKREMKLDLDSHCRSWPDRVGG